MTKNNLFSGVLTAIITPFKNTRTHLSSHNLSSEPMSIDLDAFHKLIASQKKAGISGVVVLGTTGEAPAITDEEGETLVATALEYQSDTFQIIVGTGTNSTATTIAKSVKYANFKANGKSPDGLLIVTPYYNKPMQEHLVLHYREVCASVPETPVCLYNVPGRTGVNVAVSTFCKIAAQNKNIVAIKEAAGNINTIAEMKLALNKENLTHVRILSGDDTTYAPALLCGADGIISVTSHIIPKIMCEMLDAAHKNNWNHVKDLHLNSYVLNSGLYCVTNPVGVKFLLSQLGMCQNLLRAPLYPVNETERATLLKILETLKQNNVALLEE